MNESEDRAPILLVKQSMGFCELAAVFSDFPDEGVVRFIVVVQVYFHIADAQAHHLRDTVEQLAAILFLRVEEAVLRTLSRCIKRSV